jgi:hypothetical protein
MGCSWTVATAARPGIGVGIYTVDKSLEGIGVKVTLNEMGA